MPVHTSLIEIKGSRRRPCTLGASSEGSEGNSLVIQRRRALRRCRRLCGHVSGLGGGHDRARPGRVRRGGHRIDLGRLWMQGSPNPCHRTLHIAGPTARDVIYFATPGSAPLCRNGETMESGSLVRMALHQDSFQRSMGRCAPHPCRSRLAGFARWRRRSRDAIRSHPETRSSSRRGRPRWRPCSAFTPRPAVSRKTAGERCPRGGRARPGAGADRGHGGVSLGCGDREESAAQRRHETIMRRFHAALEDRPEEAVYVPDLCARMGAQRTLEVCCREGSGVSPKRCLLLRPLTQARKALTRADPRAATVTTIAADCGFWHFGRFARNTRRSTAKAHLDLAPAPAMTSLARPAAAPAPPSFHLLAKPSGSTCNIDCTYCFFLSKDALYPNDKHRMSRGDARGLHPPAARSRIARRRSRSPGRAASRP